MDFFKFKKKASREKLSSKNKSRSKDDQMSTLPTMNSYKNLNETKRPLTRSIKPDSDIAKAPSVEFADIKPNTIYTSTSKSKFSSNANRLRESTLKNKLKLFYTYINEKDDLETRKDKVLKVINSLGKDSRRGYFTEKKVTGKKKEMAQIKVGLDKAESFKETVKSNPKLCLKADKFLENMSNPSMGVGFLKKKYPSFYKKYQGIYETNIEKNFSTKNMKDILIAMKTSNAPTNNNLYQKIEDSKVAKVKKLKLKWKTIKWFLENKKSNLDRIFQKQDVIMSKFKGGKGLNLKEFTSVMKENGITNDIDLINKLFWVFDEDGSGDIEYKELAFGLEMFRESTFDNKIKVFFDICDTDNSGAISKNEFYSLLKKNLVNSRLRLTMRQVVDKIFNSSMVNAEGEITYENLRVGCAQNQIIIDLINENLEALKRIDDVIDNEVKIEFNHIDPNKNDEIRRKLNNVKEIIFPSRDLKFEKMLNEFITCKEEQITNRRVLLDESLH